MTRETASPSLLSFFLWIVSRRHYRRSFSFARGAFSVVCKLVMARILLIEDDESIRMLLRENLARDGHAVTTAANGREGLERYRPGAFDLVITDLIMPEKEGIEVLQDLRVRDPGMKAIAMSGGGQFGAADTYLRLATLLGAGKVLAKPFTRDQFLAAVNEALGAAAP
jgi:DNA-binding NtrC family response regulator